MAHPAARTKYPPRRGNVKREINFLTFLSWESETKGLFSGQDWAVFCFPASASGGGDGRARGVECALPPLAPGAAGAPGADAP